MNTERIKHSFLIAALLGACIISTFSAAATEQAQAEHAEFIKRAYGVSSLDLGDEIKQSTLDEATSENLRIRQLIMFAEYLIGTGKFEEAVDYYQEAAEVGRDDYLVKVGLLEAYRRAYRHDEAMTLADEILQEHPDSVEALRVKGKLLERRRENDLAVEAYRQALEYEPNNLEILNLLGKLSFTMGDLDQATSAMEKITTLDGQNVYAYYILGASYLKQAANASNEATSETEEADEEQSDDISEAERAFLEKAASNFERALNLRNDIPDFFISLGRVYQQMDDMEKAHSVYRRAVAAFPDSKNFQRLFELTIEGNPGKEEILEAYRKLSELDPGNSTLKQLYLDRAINYEQYDVAIALYKELVEEESTNLEHYVNLGDLLIKTENYEEALKTFRDASHVEKDNPMVLVGLGNVHFRQGEFHKAIEQFEKAIEVKPDNQLAYLLLFQCFEALAGSGKDIDLPDARKYLERYNERFGEKEFVYFLLGRMEENAGNVERAIDNYEKSISLNPRNQQAYTRLIALYLGQNDRDKMEWLVEKGRRELEGEKPDFDIMVGHAYFDNYRYEDARRHYERALKNGSKNVKLISNLASIYSMTNREEQIQSLVTRIDELIEEPLVRYHLLGGIYYEDKKFSKSAKVLEKAIDTHGESSFPENDYTLFQLYKQLVFALASANKSKEVDDILDKLEARYDGGKFEEELLWIRSNALTLMKRYSDAIDVAKKLLEHYGENDAVYYFLGSRYFDISNMEKAEEMFRKAIEINPGNAEAYNFLGYMFAEKGIRLNEAQEAVEKAYRMQPRAGHIIDSLGWVHFKKGEFDKAVNLLEKAVTLSRPDPTIHDHLGDAYFKIGNTEQAILNWKRSLELGFDNAKEVEKKIKRAERKAR